MTKFDIVSIGSLNIDYVYDVSHCVLPGETLASTDYRRFAGGKGSNQSLALGRAGVSVAHVGRIGSDGVFIRDLLQESGVDTSHVEVIGGPSGHAIIQVTGSGENAIVIHGGANQELDDDFLSGALESLKEAKFLLFQNETSGIPLAMQKAKELGIDIVFNPAPMDDFVTKYPLELVKIFIVNEIEGERLTGESKPGEILKAMEKKYPNAATVLTLGKDGAMYTDGSSHLEVPAEQVEAVDTTAAGDTFIGYFLAGLLEEKPTLEALQMGCKAAAVCVTKKGAADSIPFVHDL